MNIRIDVASREIRATLDDNETARDFASLLPLTLTLEDYSATEKISDLPKRLSTKRRAARCRPLHWRYHVLRAVGESRHLLQRLRVLNGADQDRHH
jgi:hypothetical protein